VLLSRIVNVRVLAPGTQVTLADGSRAEIVSNPADGIWVFARYLTSPADTSREGTEELIFAPDIVEVLGDEPRGGIRHA